MPSSGITGSLLLLGCAMLSAVSPSAATVRMVTTTADTGAGSLRKAITETWNYDTIGISLPGTDTIALKSAIEITKRITILGKNQRTGNRTVIQVDTPRVSPYRVFTLSACGRYPASDTCVLIKNVVLRGGRVWQIGRAHV